MKRNFKCLHIHDRCEEILHLPCFVDKSFVRDLRCIVAIYALLQVTPYIAYLRIAYW